MTAQAGPRLTITGTCEGCAHLRTSNVVLTCSHPQIRKGLTGFAIIATKASHEAWDMRGDVRHDCPLLPAARLALARSVVAEAEPSRSGEAWFDTWAQGWPTTADTADECSAAHGAGESEE